MQLFRNYFLGFLPIDSVEVAFERFQWPAHWPEPVFLNLAEGC